MNPLPLLHEDQPLADPHYLRLKEYLIESTGLAYYIDKDTDLARRIRRRLSELQLRDCASYLELLADPSRGGFEMDALIAEITIGETYFFRHQEHFDALREIVLPDLIARNSGKRRLRVWCAGCADGAEPYSLAILLRRELAHPLLGWDVSILGTDINRRDLAIAREGRFEAWSLRSTPEELRRACFEQEGREWILAPAYRSAVSFRFHNLMDEACPPLASDPSSFDLILCRNVMIYFEPEQMRRIIQRFHDCLEPGAWLLVGPSEPNMTHFTSFRAVNAPGVTLYQRVAPSLPEFAQAPQLPAIELPPAALPEPPEAPAAAPAPTLAALRRHADEGDWENAARAGRELAESDTLNALVHFHYALVLEHLGDQTGAERSLRRAIYLDRQAVLAHYHLGLLLRSRGDWRQAERSFHNALDLLACLPGDAVVAGADEITVAELSKLARTQLERLQVQA
ncbi:MAG TPA: protein-glutamate O-methyltransferase CheR [Bryobacteraceae bacterium]|nr:protein-glutamate O-methyltransferase CheR [Bryobacteraceae bacterium]